MGTLPDREALFISHANPEDNDFTRWLGAKLTAMGYEVWADVRRLHGGADWSRELEEALRTRAIKMLLVCTPATLDKQGVRNEIEIATQLGTQFKDREFIIPLRLKPYEAPFRIAQAQYIDFSGGWAGGLAELVELLVHVHQIPRQPGRPMEDWLATQRVGATLLAPHAERLISNWLPIRKLPRAIRYCEPRSGFPVERFQDRNLHRWPIIPFAAGLLTFMRPNGKGFLTEEMPARLVCDLPIRAFLDKGWKRLEIPAGVARRHFADLANHAFEMIFQNCGLTFYESSGGRRAWWGNIRTVPLTKVQFDWPQQKGRRQIIGVSDKRRVHWHYAVSPEVRTAPIRHIRLSARLIFSENGLDAIADVNRMHRLRRSFARSWRNARWRDMMAAFLWWLVGGRSELEVPVSDDQRMVLGFPTLRFSAPITALHVGEEPPDEDDPDVEWDTWDEEIEDAAEDEDPVT